MIIRKMKELKEFKLLVKQIGSNNPDLSIDSEEIKGSTLYKALHDIKNTKDIDASGIVLPEETKVLLLIAAMLPGLKNLYSVDFSANNITNKQFKKIIDLLKASTTLRKLDIAKNNLEEDGIFDILERIKELKIHTLNISLDQEKGLILPKTPIDFHSRTLIEATAKYQITEGLNLLDIQHDKIKGAPTLTTITWEGIESAYSAHIKEYTEAKTTYNKCQLQLIISELHGTSIGQTGASQATNALAYYREYCDPTILNVPLGALNNFFSLLGVCHDEAIETKANNDNDNSVKKTSINNTLTIQNLGIPLSLIGDFVDFKELSIVLRNFDSLSERKIEGNSEEQCVEYGFLKAYKLPFDTISSLFQEKIISERRAIEVKQVNSSIGVSLFGGSGFSELISDTSDAGNWSDGEGSGEGSDFW